MLFRSGTQINTSSNIQFNPNITYGNVTDGENNNYKTVTIGTQVWMAENLKVTKYNDGTTISNITDNTAWSNLTTGAVSTYNNTINTDTIMTYGRLYNWYAVNTGKLCPTGWHVPSDAEWTTLTQNLGGSASTGRAIKETGTIHWTTPNTNANNISGFTALPGGTRYGNGLSFDFGKYGYWWSSTESFTINSIGINLSYNNSGITNFISIKIVGNSVRCLRD